MTGAKVQKIIILQLQSHISTCTPHRSILFFYYSSEYILVCLYCIISCVAYTKQKQLYAWIPFHSCIPAKVHKYPTFIFRDKHQGTLDIILFGLYTSTEHFVCFWGDAQYFSFLEGICVIFNIF